MSVCRQIRAETTSLFFSLNTFQLYNLPDLSRFARVLSQQGVSDAITSISISAMNAPSHRGVPSQDSDTAWLLLFPLLESIHIFMARLIDPYRQTLIGLALRDITGRMALEITFED
jgi:hypothetical protein